MISEGNANFTDPELYQEAIRPAQVEIHITAKGDFRAELTRTELSRLWMQCGRETLPRIANSKVGTERLPIFFLASADQVTMRYCGRDLAFGEIVITAAGMTHHHRTDGPCHWASLSPTQEDLRAASLALVGRDLVLPTITRYLRPDLPTLSRLLNLQQIAAKIPEYVGSLPAQPEPARALEHALMHTLITCLKEGTSITMSRNSLRHTAIIARFEELLAAKCDQPLYLADICAEIGVCERTLRSSCVRHLGMGPVRYLSLRRMHLAHRALVVADKTKQTVAEIATRVGFWELGRFAVEYRALFGETPSASLHRSPQEMRISTGSPFVFAD